MEKQQQIIDVIKSIQDDDALEYIYQFVSDFKKTFISPSNEEVA